MSATDRHGTFSSGSVRNIGGTVDLIGFQPLAGHENGMPRLRLHLLLREERTPRALYCGKASADRALYLTAQGHRVEITVHMIEGEGHITAFRNVSLERILAERSAGQPSSGE